MEENENLRKILAFNIRKHREMLDISQEKLAEQAGISVYMLRDIEYCRTWVSDKTLSKIARAFDTETYRLFMDAETNKNEFYKTAALDFALILRKIREEVNSDIENALKYLENEDQ
jgi:transcriptional regulator with XRE-family HTH domain